MDLRLLSWAEIPRKQIRTATRPLPHARTSACTSLFLSSVVSMSTLYVLSLRSEEDLVDIDG